MHFGLDAYVSYILYGAAIAAFFLSVFWRPIVGIFYLLPLIPLQTIRYRTNDLPLGESLVGIVLLGVALGLLRRRQAALPKTPWTTLVAVYAVFTYVSLCLGSSYLGQAFPFPGDVRFGGWREYMVMPAMLLLTIAVQPTKRQMQAIVLVLCLGTVALDKSFWNAVSDKEFSTYSEESHEEGGGMGYAGGNGLAAFTAQATVFILALAGYEKRRSLQFGYYGIALFSAVCLMYSLSRGGYLAFLVGCVVIGLLKQRKLLVGLGLLLFTWTLIVPPAVQQRIEMTYNPTNRSLDNSSATRLSLWNNAMDVFAENVWLGAGFNTYAYMHLNKRSDGVYYADTHNYFVKVLVETGVVGMCLFLWLLFRMLGDSYQLLRHARDPFFASLGLGAIGWVMCSIVANSFGDRWTFLQVNGYMWVIIGLVCRARELERSAEVPVEKPTEDFIATTEPLCPTL
jgi:O-antigen ligase